MKHAFPGDKTGEITVEFYPEDKNLVLKVSDDGVGFPDDLDFRKVSSLVYNL